MNTSPNTTATNVKHRGIVAILDALGAATFGDAEIDRFLKARERVLEKLATRLEQSTKPTWDRQQFSIFTFNDTVVMALRSKEEKDITDQRINFFFRLVREFFIEALIGGILFRGACAIGSFRVDKDNNTILGEAISDAAAWYDKAEWIGLITTPRTTLHLKERCEVYPTRTFLCLDHSIPLKDGRAVTLKALNWRTVLAHDTYKEQLVGRSERAWFLSCLSSHQVPYRTETKYFNSLAFFDACEGRMQSPKSPV